MKLRAFFSSLILLAGSFSIDSYGEKRLLINIPQYELKVYDGEILLATFAVRVGKPATPTPIGEGVIAEKREQVIFRYGEGERAGQIIRWSRMNPTSEIIRMPYERMRGLRIDMKVGNDYIHYGQIIHTTTDYWTVGFPASKGCLGLLLEDMLKLYDFIDRVPTTINLEYETITLAGNDIIFYADIYSRGANSLGRLKSAGVEIRDITSAQNRLNLIQIELDYGLTKVRQKINAGKDARLLRDLLFYRVSRSKFLEPCYPQGEIISGIVQAGEGFVNSLKKAGLSEKASYQIVNSLQGINYRKLQVDDIFTIITEGEKNRKVVSFEYKGRQGELKFDLREKDIFWE